MKTFRSNNRTVSVVIIQLTLLIIFLLSPFLTANSQIESSTNNLPFRETVVINTDRSIYLPGGEILLYASLHETDNYKISHLSKIIRIEILNSSGDAILQEKLVVTDGKVSQSIQLPNSLPTGWYQLRAYTSWMRNFDIEDFSALNIRIINPSDLKKVAIKDSPDSINIEVITSSGRLLPGIINHCAVRATDQFGNPHSVEGAILSSNSDTITGFKTGLSGWGKISFLPKEGASYNATVRAETNAYVLSEFPSLESSGYIIDIKPEFSQIELTLKGIGLLPGKVKLLVHSLYSWHWFVEAEIESEVVKFIIPSNNIPDGVIQFTILDNMNSVLAERLYISNKSVSDASILNLDDIYSGSGKTINVDYLADNREPDGLFSLISRRYEPGERASLYIPGLPGWSAKNEIPTDSNEREAWTIANKYNRSVAASFFNSNGSNPIIRELNYKDLTSVRESSYTYLPETRGLTINGHIDGSTAEEKFENRDLSLTVLNNNSFYSARVYENGNFHFSIPQRTGPEDMVLSYTRLPEQSWKLTISPDFDTRRSVLPPSRISITTEELEYVKDLSTSMQLDALYAATSGIDSSLQSNGSLIDKPMFYGYPDRTVHIDEFIRLPNLREVIFEVVPSVVARKDGDNFTIRVVNQQPFPKPFYTLVLLDGIPLNRFDQLLELSPERIKKIEVVENLYIHGNILYAGIVSFISVNGDLAGLELPIESQIISMEMPLNSMGLDILKEYEKVDHFPEMSGTLKIDPFISKSSGSINFKSTDNYGDYIVVLKGFTSSGRWVSSVKKFTVN
jgi:hypothetical protein